MTDKELKKLSRLELLELLLAETRENERLRTELEKIKQENTIKKSAQHLNATSENLGAALQQVSSIINSLDKVSVVKEEAKKDSSPVEIVKGNEVQIDEVQIDEVQIDEVQTDEVQIDEVQIDEVQIDEVQIDEVQIDEVQIDEVQIDEVQLDEAQIDEVQIDEVQIDETQSDEAEIDRAEEIQKEQAVSEAKEEVTDVEDKNDLFFGEVNTTLGHKDISKRLDEALNLISLRIKEMDRLAGIVNMNKDGLSHYDD